MSEDNTLRYEFVNDEVFVLDSDAGVVHRLTGHTAQSVREAPDEVSRRQAIKLSLAGGVGVVTMLLPSAAAAASGGVGGLSVTTVTVTSVANGSVSLTWDTVAGATSYTVNYKIQGAASYTSEPSVATTSGTVTGLTNGTTYLFTVTASAAGMTSTTSSSVTATPNDNIPGTPTLFTATLSGTTATLNWAQGTGADPTTYIVRYGYSSPYSTEAGAISAPTTTTTLESLRRGETYTFFLKALNDSGESEETSIDLYIPNPPNAPGTVTASLSGSNAVVTWTGPSGGGEVASYTLQYRLASDPDTNDSYTTVSEDATPPSTVTGLIKGSTYIFRVIAVNADGSSSKKSNSLTIPDPPTVPVSVTADRVGMGTTTAQVTWSAPVGGAPVTSYALHYRLAGDADSDVNYVVASTNATSPADVSGLVPGLTYVFRVVAVNAYGSASANSADLYMLNPPGNVTNLVATPGDRTVTITWDPPVTGGTPTSYVVSYGIGNVLTVLPSLNASTRTYTFASLTNGSTYRFVVEAANADYGVNGVNVYAVPVGTNQTAATTVYSVGPIATITTTPTTASLTVDSGGTGYEYELDGASAVSVNAGSTTSLSLTAATHTLVVRKQQNNAEVEATVVLNTATRTGSTSSTTTMYIPNVDNGPRTMSMTMVGGTGGIGGADGANGGGAAGQPGRVTGTFVVAKSDYLQYATGTGGGTGASSATGTGAGTAGLNPMVGYDGGVGGNPGSSGNSGAGGGGGAASVVIRGGTASRTFVAAGGGGGGGGAGDGVGTAGRTYSAVTGNGTSGGAGQNFGGGDGAGGGGGGGGSVGGAGGLNSSTGTESYGLGGRAGSNATASESGLSSTTATGYAAGSTGVVTLSYYEPTSLVGTSRPQVSATTLVAATPLSGSAPTVATGVGALSGNGAVQVSWNAVAGATRYLVYVRRTGTTTWGYGGSTTGTSLGVKALRNGTSYDFAVRTMVGAKTSDLSSVASATPWVIAASSPIIGATTTMSLATVTLDNLAGCTYTYAVDGGSSSPATGLATVTAALSGNWHIVAVTKGYYDGTDAVTITRRVRLDRTSVSSGLFGSGSYSVPAGTFGPREMSLVLRGAGGGQGGSDDVSGGYSYRVGEVEGLFAVQASDLVSVYGGNAGGNGSKGRAAGGGGAGTNAYSSAYNGGSGGTSGGALFTSSGSGGGGGAASLLARTRSGSTTVLAVAGGGGGGGGSGTYNDQNRWQDATDVHAAVSGNGTAGGGGENRSSLKDGGGGGGGGGGAVGGKGGTIYEYNGETDVSGDPGRPGANSVSGLSTSTLNRLTPYPAAGQSWTDLTGVPGEATITYYGVSGSATGVDTTLNTVVTTEMSADGNTASATIDVGLFPWEYDFTYAVDGGVETAMGSAVVTVSGLSFVDHTIAVRKKLNGATVASTISTLTASSPTVAAGNIYTNTTLFASGVRRLYAYLIGGRGGRGGNDTYTASGVTSTVDGGAPGSAYYATGTVRLVANATLTVAMGTGGAQGGDVTDSTGTGAGGAGGTNPMTGYDGGAGSAMGATNRSGGGGGGGGATVLQLVDGLTKLLVAPGGSGGGGAQANSSVQNAGSAGSETHSPVSGNATSGGVGASRTGETGGNGGGGAGAVGGLGGSSAVAVGAGGRPGTTVGTNVSDYTNGTSSRTPGQDGAATVKFMTVSTGTAVDNLPNLVLTAFSTTQVTWQQPEV